MTEDDRPGMSEDEVMDALGELYREGKVDMVPTVGNVDPKKQQFSLNEDGREYARDLFRESDDAVLHILGIHVSRNRPYDSQKEVAEAVIEFAEWFAEDTGVNPLRVINRHIDRVPFISEPLPAELVEYYDQEADNDE